MGDFLNQFAANVQVLPALIIFMILVLPIFGYFYNKLMDQLTGRSEHTSLYVAIGVGVTILAGALFSWKSAIMYFALFVCSGLPMIIGEFRRTEAKKVKAKTVRRKRLPYAANGCIEDAHDALTEAQRLLGLAMRNNGKNVESAIPLAHASTELNRAIGKLVELRLIQNIEK